MRATLAVGAAILLAAAASAQVPAAAKDTEPVLVAPPRDPYTGGDSKQMAAAGVVAYAPLPWSGDVTTAEIDNVLGPGRVLWLETAHCRVGCGLRATPLPAAAAKRRYYQDALHRLAGKLPHVDERPKTVDPWLHLHLFAQQAEELYEDLHRRIGIDDSEFTGGQPPHGKYLGLPDKFLLLVLQRKSDLARYLGRYCGVQGDRSYRCCMAKPGQVVVAVALEGPENMDTTGLSCWVAYSLVHAFLDGYRGFDHDLPTWLIEGLAHWYERTVPSEFINATVKKEDAVDPLKQHLWPERVHRWAQHDGNWLRWNQLVALTDDEQFGYREHLMAWSRVDYLMAQNEAKVGDFVRELKHLPPPWKETRAQQLQAVQPAMLQRLFGCDAAAFDENWRRWVLKTYGK
jgi:hypothetical protein